MASSRVRDDLVRQRKETLVAIAHLKGRLGERERDLDEIDVAIAAIDSTHAKNDLNRARAEILGPTNRATIQDMVMQVLELLPRGATATEIQEHILTRFGVEVERSSLSPQLSRLKADDRVELLGRIWVSKEIGHGLSVAAAIRALDQITDQYDFDLPDMKVPDFDVPNFDVPDIDVAPISFPEVELRSVSFGTDAMIKALSGPSSDNRPRPRLRNRRDPE